MNCGLRRFAKTAFLAFGTLFLGIQVFAPLQRWEDCSVYGTVEKQAQKETIALQIIRDNGLIVTTIGNEENFLPPVNPDRQRYFAQTNQKDSFISKLSKSLQGTLFTDASVYNTTDKPDITVETRPKDGEKETLQVLGEGDICQTQLLKPFWVGVLVSGTLGVVFGLSYFGYIREEEKKAGLKLKKKGFFKSFFK